MYLRRERKEKKEGGHPKPAQPAATVVPAARTAVRWPPMVSDEHYRDLSAKRGDVGGGVANRRLQPQSAPLDQRPASKLGVADFVAKGWTYRVIGGGAKGDAVVEFTSPDGSMREERTIPRGMLPSEEPRTVGKDGRSVLRLGKTRHDHESGSWDQHRDNREARRERNRGHAHGDEGKK